MKKVSIVVAVYNASKTIERCIESLLYQSYPNIEIILVEDCSKDDSYEKCLYYEKQYGNVKLLKNKKNSGVSATRNQGISVAEGEYICFVDSDDWVHYQYCEELVKGIERNKTDIVVCGFIFKDYLYNNEQVYIFNQATEYSFFEKKDALFLYERMYFNALWNKIFKMDIIKKNNIRFEEGLALGEDIRFTVEYLSDCEKDSIIVLNKACYYYCRYNENSLVGQGWKTDIHDILKNIDILYEKLIVKDECSRACYEKNRRNVVCNYIYDVIFNKEINKRNKKNLLNCLAKEFEMDTYISDIQMLHFKNELIVNINKGKKSIKTIKYYFQNYKKKFWIKKNMEELKVKEISIISQNGIGGALYQDMKQFCFSPTINLFFEAQDFMKFVLNMKYYIELPMKMHWENYPIGILDDITINFINYDTCFQAESMWNERKNKIKFDKIFILCTDQNGFDMETYKMWEKIRYPKLLFTVNPQYSEEALYYEEYSHMEVLPEIIDNREFYKNKVLIKKLNKVYK